MSFDLLGDFANEANREVGNFRLDFILSPDKMQRDDYDVEALTWDSIRFGDAAEIDLNEAPFRGLM